MEKKFTLLIITLVILFSACLDVDVPLIDEQVLTYSAETSESGYTADIAYRNENNEILLLEDESLPWSVTLSISENFTGIVYLSVHVPAEQVFIPYLTGTANSAGSYKLIDTAADFIEDGVIAGDKVFKTDDPTVQSNALVSSVEDANTLQLNTDLFPLGTEQYYVYHKKTLNVKVSLDSEIIETDTVESERLLSSLVQTRIDM